MVHKAVFGGYRYNPCNISIDRLNMIFYNLLNKAIQLFHRCQKAFSSIITTFSCVIYLLSTAEEITWCSF